MKLEDQVCSLELAKKLKELGVKQESLFYWWFVRNDMGDDVFVSDTKPVNGTEYWSAFTVAELGEMLPVRINGGRRKYRIDGLPVWFCNYAHKSNNHMHSISADTEADARAAMLVYLLENNLITNP